METNVIIDVHKLWELTKNHKVQSMKTVYLTHLLDMEIWDDDEGKDISPNKVLQSIETNKPHWMKINNADLSYPILIVCREIDKKVIDILDGFHRLCKAIINGIEEIDVIFVNNDDINKLRIA
jgi:hypothetical protein